jgi:hypothetical protein
MTEELQPEWLIIWYRNPGSKVDMSYTVRNDEDEVQGVKLGLKQTGCIITNIEEFG